MGRVSSTAASTLGSGVTTPSIQNINVTAGVEATISIPAGSTRFYIKHRRSSKFEVRYSATPSDFFSNKGGNVYTREGLAPTTTYTLYITCLNTGVLEVESWS